VDYERILKLDCNQNFYLNTNFTETLLLKEDQIIFSSDDVVAGEMLSVEKL
jgi:hypothetical protein